MTINLPKKPIITFGEMAEALYSLRKKYGLMKGFSQREIFITALKKKYKKYQT